MIISRKSLQLLSLAFVIVFSLFSNKEVSGACEDRKSGKTVTLTSLEPFNFSLISQGFIYWIGYDSDVEGQIWPEQGSSVARGFVNEWGSVCYNEENSYTDWASDSKSVHSIGNVFFVKFSDNQTVVKFQVESVNHVRRSITIYYEYENAVTNMAIAQVSAKGHHTVGLITNGNVVATGLNGYGQCDVSSWRNIVQVAAGGYHTVGLKSDGSVIAVGNCENGQCNVDSWRGIVQVAAGGLLTAGLKANGTVVATGLEVGYGINVSSWTNIVQIVGTWTAIYGLKSDGTVVATGYNDTYGALNVSSWSKISQIDACVDHIVGLKSDFSVVGAGRNDIHQLDFGRWASVFQIAAGRYHTIGLVYSYPYNNVTIPVVIGVGSNANGQLNTSTWKPIEKISAGLYTTIGLKLDGTVVATGDNSNGALNVGNWNLKQASFYDSDGDGVPDSSDAFPSDANEWLDTDKDGIGNNADTDDDNDGMPDSWEIANGLNPLVNDANLDKDGDGFKNLREYRAGSKPNDPNSIPKTATSLPSIQLLLE